MGHSWKIQIILPWLKAAVFLFSARTLKEIARYLKVKLINKAPAGIMTKVIISSSHGTG
jgi:hypothetical protein